MLKWGTASVEPLCVFDVKPIGATHTMVNQNTPQTKCSCSVGVSIELLPYQVEVSVLD